MLCFLSVLSFFVFDHFFSPNGLSFLRQSVSSFFSFFSDFLGNNLPKGLHFLFLVFFPVLFLSFLLFLTSYVSLLFYFCLLIVLLLSCLPFSSFISDCRQAVMQSSCSAHPWLSDSGSSFVISSEDDKHSFLLTSFLVFERFIFAPLVFFLLMGHWGLLFYFFSYQARIFGQKQGISSSFFPLFFEWVDAIPSRFLVFLVCFLTHFSRFFHTVSWSFRPSLKDTSDAFLSDFFSSVLNSFPEEERGETCLALFKHLYFFFIFFVLLLFFIQLDAGSHPF